VDNFLLQKLLEDLHHPDETLRDRATDQLWQAWFGQKGETGFKLLKRAQFLYEVGETHQAENLLNETILTYPDFAEAWNRRAIFYYIQQDYDRSKTDCQQVVRLVPYHFGAWHGLGLCDAALGHYLEAIQSFRQALTLQPHALINQKLILECTAKLS
jgi:tetratricopeptide (TPR) repeat protein